MKKATLTYETFKIIIQRIIVKSEIFKFENIWPIRFDQIVESLYYKTKVICRDCVAAFCLFVFSFYHS